MNENTFAYTPTFLSDDPKELNASIVKLNLFLSGNFKPYKIDYHLLLMSYYLWNGKDIDDFCEKQTVAHFLLNPMQDSAEAREAFFFEVREFLLGQ